MEIKVEQVSDSYKFFDLLFLLRKNDYHPDEFDSGWEGWLHFVITTVYNNPNFICFVLYKDNWPVGYAITQGPSPLNSEVEVVDVFVDKEHQGDGLIYLLVDSMLDLCEKAGVKRVSWASSTLPESYWQELFGKVNINIQTKKIYKIKFDNEYTNIKVKEKVNEIHESIQ